MGAHGGRRVQGNRSFIGADATGGTVMDVEINGVAYRVHAFTDVGEHSFEVTRDGECDVLVVAGGGGGGGASASGGSGGGGGGVVRANISTTAGQYNVAVGDRGPRGDGTGNIGFNGGNSTFHDLVAIGGGGGEGGGTASGKAGGSGGGSRGTENSRGGDYGEELQPGTNPSAIIDAGNPGGFGPSSGGGGGGAGSPGGIENGSGGKGLLINFDGTSRFYGPGGNGQFTTEKSGGQTTDQEETLPNVGAGGAGTYSSTRTGNVGIGGSGVVIVRYTIPNFPVEASGGTELEVEDDNGIVYRVHAFTDVGEDTFDVSSGGAVDCLIVAGGGGGSSYGGGGAGGVVQRSLNIGMSSYSVSVGSGGSGAQFGTNGSNSEFIDITAIGGGAGGTHPSSSTESGGLDGGSGGGAGARDNLTNGAALQPNSVHGGLGNDGGEYVQDNNGSGGGGAGSVGKVGDSSRAGAGGDGIFVGDLFSMAIGEDGWIAGGGGGGGWSSPTNAGGLANSGAGAGGYAGDGAENATNNTGSGGGGAGQSVSSGGDGGSGVVLVRYPVRFRLNT